MTVQPEPGLVGLESTIGRVLQWGTLVSSVCLGAGLLMALAGYEIGVSESLAVVGLLVLMATPALRVVVSLVEYARERDWLFVVLTAIVLTALGGSVVAAFFF